MSNNGSLLLDILMNDSASAICHRTAEDRTRLDFGSSVTKEHAYENKLFVTGSQPRPATTDHAPRGR